MTHPIIERRLAERANMIDGARSWALLLPQELGVVCVVVFGSVARGDFNKWSDVDVLVVADHLPDATRDRMALLVDRHTPPGLQPVAWTPAELDARTRRGDPIALEAASVGQVVLGSLAPPVQT